MTQTFRALLAAPLLALAAGIATAAGPQASGELVYTSVAGDHLSGIARRFLEGADSADNVRRLHLLNPGRHPDVLPVGTALRLPRERVRFEPASARVVSAYGAAHQDGSRLAAGSSLAVGDAVATGASGGVLLELANGSRVVIRENSRVSVEQLRGVPALGHSEAQLGLQQGRVEVRVQPQRGGTRFELRSPVATLGVRGTTFRAGVEDGGTSRVEVLTGLVGATGTADARAVDVAAGFGSVVDRSGRASAPRPLLPAPDLAGLAATLEHPVVRLRLPAQEGAAAWRADVLERGSGRVLASTRFDSPALAFAGLPDGDYALVARAIAADGLEGVEARRDFALRARPEPPLPLTPAPGSRVWGDAAELAWAGAADAVRYRLRLWPQPMAVDAAGAASGAAAAVVEPAGSAASGAADTPSDRTVQGTAYRAALAPGDYAWRVASVDAGGRQGPFSAEQRFSLRPAQGPLPPPAIDAQTVQLRWSGEPGQRFDVLVARDAAFADLLVERRTDTPELRFARPFEGRYFIRLRARDPDGFVGPWSPTQTLDVPAPPWRWLPEAETPKARPQVR